MKKEEVEFESKTKKRKRNYETFCDETPEEVAEALRESDFDEY